MILCFCGSMIILLTLQGVRSGKGGLEMLSMQICGLSGRKTGLFLYWASCSECVTSLEGWLLNSWLSKPQPLQGWGNPVSPLPPAAGPTGLHPSSATGSVPLPIVVSSMAEQTQSPQPPLDILGSAFSPDTLQALLLSWGTAEANVSVKPTA